MKHPRGFASDNNSGVHPQVMQAIINANVSHAVGYGDDVYTTQAKELFAKAFGAPVDVYFVFNGTGANVIALQSLTRAHEATICAATAHINVDECGAPEKFTGGKLLTVNTYDGKLTVEHIKSFLHGFGDQHHVQPRVVSITQTTELGTVYQLTELKAICDFAHENNMLVHMDGARIANAAAYLNCTFKEMTRDVGVDVVSFGGTKNGMMFGEAVLFFNPELSNATKFMRKQSAQLHSKMRFISAQFIAMLESDLWLQNALHSNRMAALLKAELLAIPQVKITREVESNGLFVKVPASIIEPLQQEYFFYVWDHEASEVRWMTSFDTTEQDIYGFVAKIKELVKQ
jgi:threonine aldolase